MALFKRRPLWPQHATAHEALQFVASVCDGTKSHDSMGFCRDHLVWGNFFASTPPEQWLPVHHQSALFMVRYYRRQLTNAGFDVNQILGGHRPRRCTRREAKSIAPAWRDDP